ncbi:MAG: protein kinase [Vulcanimicrobiota bacterium]
MKCPQCNIDNLGNARFCENCGASLASRPQPIGIGPGMMLQNRYRIDSRIGGGAMGSVYKIWDTHLEKDFALKEVCPIAGSDRERQEVLARFKTEAQLLSTLHHTSIPRVMDYFSEGAGHYLVMDLITGDDLERLVSLKGKPGLPVKEVKEMAVRILDVLVYLHSQNPPVLYRDMKPSNVMKRSSDGSIFLVDFGIAKTLATLKKDAGTAIGTEGYSPPEQYEGKTEPRSDLYALGATMHHMLSGQTPLVPFKFGPLSGVSEPLQSFIDKALKLNPQERFTSAAEMRQILISLDAPRAPQTERMTIQKAAAASSVPLPAASLQMPVSSATSVSSAQPTGAVSSVASGSSAQATHAPAASASPSLQTGAGQTHYNGGAQKSSSGWLRQGRPLMKLFVLLILGAMMGMALFVWKVPDRVVKLLSQDRSDTAHSHPAKPGSPWEDEVKETIRDSMKAIEKRDLKKHMSYYADMLDVYYNKKNCTRDFVERDKKRAIDKFHTIKNTISNLYVYRINDSNAKAIFDKEWDCRNGIRFAGKERQRILLRFIGKAWKIVGEEELEIYWVTR